MIAGVEQSPVDGADLIFLDRCLEKPYTYESNLQLPDVHIIQVQEMVS